MLRTPKVYIIGSLRDPAVPEVARELRELGFNVFDDWFAAGEIADDSWRDYEKGRGHTFKEALQGLAAHHVFEFDKKHLDEADIGVLVCPSGKSCHLEIGYLAGRGKPTYVLLDPAVERFDVMYLLCTEVCDSLEELLRVVTLGE